MTTDTQYMCHQTKSVGRTDRRSFYLAALSPAGVSPDGPATLTASVLLPRYRTETLNVSTYYLPLFSSADQSL